MKWFMILIIQHNIASLLSPVQNCVYFPRKDRLRIFQFSIKGTYFHLFFQVLILFKSLLLRSLRLIWILWSLKITFSFFVFIVNILVGSLKVFIILLNFSVFFLSLFSSLKWFFKLLGNLAKRFTSQLIDLDRNPLVFKVTFQAISFIWSLVQQRFSFKKLIVFLIELLF